MNGWQVYDSDDCRRAAYQDRQKEKIVAEYLATKKEAITPRRVIHARS